MTGIGETGGSTLYERIRTLESSQKAHGSARRPPGGAPIVLPRERSERSRRPVWPDTDSWVEWPDENLESFHSIEHRDARNNSARRHKVTDSPREAVHDPFHEMNERKNTDTHNGGDPMEARVNGFLSRLTSLAHGDSGAKYLKSPRQKFSKPDPCDGRTGADPNGKIISQKGVEESPQLEVFDDTSSKFADSSQFETGSAALVVARKGYSRDLSMFPAPYMMGSYMKREHLPPKSPSESRNDSLQKASEKLSLIRKTIAENKSILGEKANRSESAGDTKNLEINLTYSERTNNDPHGNEPHGSSPFDSWDPTPSSLSMDPPGNQVTATQASPYLRSSLSLNSRPSFLENSEETEKYTRGDFDTEWDEGTADQLIVPISDSLTFSRDSEPQVSEREPSDISAPIMSDPIRDYWKSFSNLKSRGSFDSVSLTSDPEFIPNPNKGLKVEQAVLSPKGKAELSKKKRLLSPVLENAASPDTITPNDSNTNIASSRPRQQEHVNSHPILGNMTRSPAKIQGMVESREKKSSSPKRPQRRPEKMNIVDATVFRNAVTSRSSHPRSTPQKKQSGLSLDKKWTGISGRASSPKARNERGRSKSPDPSPSASWIRSRYERAKSPIRTNERSTTSDERSNVDGNKRSKISPRNSYKKWPEKQSRSRSHSNSPATIRDTGTVGPSATSRTNHSYEEWPEKQSRGRSHSNSPAAIRDTGTVGPSATSRTNHSYEEWPEKQSRGRSHSNSPAAIRDTGTVGPSATSRTNHSYEEWPEKQSRGRSHSNSPAAIRDTGTVGPSATSRTNHSYEEWPEKQSRGRSHSNSPAAIRDTGTVGPSATSRTNHSYEEWPEKQSRGRSHSNSPAAIRDTGTVGPSASSRMNHNYPTRVGEKDSTYSYSESTVGLQDHESARSIPEFQHVTLPAARLQPPRSVLTRERNNNTTLYNGPWNDGSSAYQYGPTLSENLDYDQALGSIPESSTYDQQPNGSRRRISRLGNHGSTLFSGETDRDDETYLTEDKTYLTEDETTFKTDRSGRKYRDKQDERSFFCGGCDSLSFLGFHFC